MLKIISYALLLSLLVTGACKRSACTDKNAENYSNKAKKDDGSCTYKGSHVFWFAPLNTPSQNNVQFVNVYVDNQLIGGMSTNSLLAGPPECGSAGVTYYADMGGEKTKLVSYSVRYTDPGGNENQIYTGTIQIKGGDCTNLQLQ